MSVDRDVLAVDRDAAILAEVARERSRQDAKWGEQNHPDGTGSLIYDHGYTLAERAEQHRQACNWAAQRGHCTWRHIAREEFSEAMAESDPARLRAELIQLAAVAVNWVGAIDRRTEAAS